MRYRIDYTTKHRRKGRHLQPLRPAALTLLSFLLFLFWVNSRWTEGADYLRSWIPSIRITGMGDAMDRFAEKLYSNETLTEVFSSLFEP